MPGCGSAFGVLDVGCAVWGVGVGCGVWDVWDVWQVWGFGDA
jgi:hypothetical protein